MCLIEGKFMLGIDDFWVALAYILCIASTVLCIVYSICKRNETDEPATDEDVEWKKLEDKIEENL